MRLIFSSYRNSYILALSILFFVGSFLASLPVAHAIRTTQYPNTAYLLGTGSEGSADGLVPSVASISGTTYDVASDLVGNLYFTDRDKHVIRFYDKASGRVTTVAGTLSQAGFQDGTNARLNGPKGIAVQPKADNTGNVYFVDEGNYAVRMYNPVTKSVSTVAGGASSSAYQDGVGTSARFSILWGIRAARNNTLYVSEGSSTGYIRKIDIATSRVSTVYQYTLSSGVYGLALDPVFQDRIYFTVFGGVYSIHMITRAVTALDTTNTNCQYLTSLVGGLLAYTCGTNMVFIRSTTNNSLVAIGSASSGYVENSAGPTGVAFNSPGGVAAMPLIRPYTQVVVVDRLNYRLRIVNVKFDATFTSELPETHTKSLQLTQTKTKTIHIPVTTTTTTVPSTTTTTPTTTTTTTTITTTTRTTTTPRPTAPAYTAAPNTTVVALWFPNASLPLMNITATTEAVTTSWVLALNASLIAAIETDVRRALGLPTAIDVNNTDSSTLESELVMVVDGEVRVNATTGEIMLHIQVPLLTEPATPSSLLIMYQSLSLSAYATTKTYLLSANETMAYSSNLCAACAGPNCFGASKRPRCASQNNNGYTPFKAPKVNPCESWYCIMAVFLACFVIGCIISYSAYRASLATAAKKNSGRYHALREETTQLRSK
eukprot:GILI01017643.1.p1 GENE.GILI01017643.1~~GILI01017643.1.p1  ORF type:complete len:670 (+),score=89.99 GILI01017643.1:37-2010(+)